MFYSRDPNRIKKNITTINHTNLFLYKGVCFKEQTLGWGVEGERVVTEQKLLGTLHMKSIDMFFMTIENTRNVKRCFIPE